MSVTAHNHTTTTQQQAKNTQTNMEVDGEEYWEVTAQIWMGKAKELMEENIRLKETVDRLKEELVKYKGVTYLREVLKDSQRVVSEVCC